MPLPFFSRWLASVARHDVRSTTSQRIVESVAPLPFEHRRLWSLRLGSLFGASAWRVSGVDAAPSRSRDSHTEALGAARLEFADALFDVRTEGAADALDRIAITRSLHELWHFRSEVFSCVARRHDQAEAARRLAVLDRHFKRRSRRVRFVPVATDADQIERRG
jgi:hypothetical protein